MQFRRLTSEKSHDMQNARESNDLHSGDRLPWPCDPVDQLPERVKKTVKDLAENAEKWKKQQIFFAISLTPT